MKVSVLLSLLITIILLSTIVSADITARVDRPVISDEDTFSLRLTIAGKGSGGEPDLAPLRKDFEVLGTGKSSRINIINGRMESRTEWKITLAPRHDGEIVIPAIEVGGDKSQPLMIKVLKASQASAGRSQDLFLEVEAGPTAPYVQSQVTYTVRLFFREISEGQLHDPEPVNALVRRIGEDVSYTAQRNNQSYRVIERRYAIFPQASGRLTVPAPMFSGKVPDGTRRQHSLFDGLGSFDQFFRNTRAVRRRGEPITLDVRPRPAVAVGGNWLPADSLTISESWSPSNPTFQVGEPVTRTITILARGLEGAQLPELPISGNKNYKVYPDQPVTPTQFQGQFVMGKREQKIAIVPTLEGSFTLPPIEIPWWDTKADLQRVASLPSRKIKVLPGNTSSPAVAASALVHPGPHSRGEEQPLRVESEKAPATRTEPISSPSMPGTDRDFWPWLVAGLLLVWLVTIWLWLRERRRSPIKTGKQVAANKPPHTPSLKSLLRAVESACKSSRAADARDALLEWGRSRWPDNPPHNLMVFGDRLGENRQVAAAILTLDRTIYGGSTGDWDGERFWRQVEPLLVAGVENKGVKEEVLPELFPV